MTATSSRKTSVSSYTLVILIEVPTWWSPKKDKSSNSAEKKTRTMLIHQRKMDKRPDISYDIDGDGVVNDKDLVLAKHFDKDGDGKLNSTEKREALKALQEGFEGRFLWGVE